MLTPDLRVQSANTAFYEGFHVTADETLGRPLFELGNRQWNIPELLLLLRQVLSEGAEFGNFEIVHAFERIGPRTMLLHARPLDGTQLILLGMVDITERKRNEQERELLARELSHRVKNILAVIQALAMQTDHSDSIEEFRDKFVGRLQAMTRAHSLLLDAQWRGADLNELVRLALLAYRTDHPDLIEVEGDSVPLTPSQGLGLNLILHELGTNAAKYGALAHHDGRVRVAWQVENSDQARASACAGRSGVERSSLPPGEGFGTRLIERAAAHELEGEVELDYRADGLRCQLVFPLAVWSQGCPVTDGADLGGGSCSWSRTSS